MTVFCKELERSNLAIRIVNQRIISAPMPVGNQNFIPISRIIMDGMMKRACTARSRTGINVSVRPGLSEALVNAAFQELFISLDRRIRDNLPGCQPCIGFLYHLKLH